MELMNNLGTIKVCVMVSHSILEIICGGAQAVGLIKDLQY